MKSTICIAEDRDACEPCLKLLLLSLRAHCPQAPVELFCHFSNVRFGEWLKSCPGVNFRSDRLQAGFGWNIKPQAILRLLDEGFDEVIWIDSDILVTASVPDLFSEIHRDALVATEDALGDERNDDNATRARLWQFEVGRVLPFVLNTGALRVTSSHRQLIERWWTLLNSETYQNVQKMPWHLRPPHMRGDQDVLTALLTSQSFRQVPIKILRRGQQIIQFNGVYGYTIRERLKHSWGCGPSLIHSFGSKPWSEDWYDSSVGLREYFKKLYLDLSPYTLSAMRYESQMASDTAWMHPHYRLSRLLRALGLNSRPLTGSPIAILMDFIRLTQHLRMRKASHEARTVAKIQKKSGEFA